MSGQVRQAGEAIAEVYHALRDTREGRHSCVLIGATTELIRCPRGVPCLRAPEVYSRSSSCGGLGRACY